MSSPPPHPKSVSEGGEAIDKRTSPTVSVCDDLNFETSKCMIVGLSKPNKVVVIPLENDRFKEASANEYFQVDLVTRHREYTACPTICGITTPREKGKRGKSKTTISIKDFVKKANEMLETKSFDELDVLKGEITKVAKIKPEFLRDIISQSQGPVLKELKFVSTASRDDEMAILHALGHTGNTYNNNPELLQSFVIDNEKLDECIPRRTIKDLEEYQTKIADGVGQKIMETESGSMDGITISVKGGLKNLTNFIVQHINISYKGREFTGFRAQDQVFDFYKASIQPVQSEDGEAESIVVDENVAKKHEKDPNNKPRRGGKRKSSVIVTDESTDEDAEANEARRKLREKSFMNIVKLSGTSYGIHRVRLMTLSDRISVAVVRVSLLQFLEMHQWTVSDGVYKYGDDIARLEMLLGEEPAADFVTGLYDFCKDDRWNKLVCEMLEMDESLLEMWKDTKASLIEMVDTDNTENINLLQHRETFLMQIDGNMKDIRKRVQNHYNEFYW